MCMHTVYLGLAQARPNLAIKYVMVHDGACDVDSITIVYNCINLMTTVKHCVVIVCE